MLKVNSLRGPFGEFGAHGVVDIEQDASRVYEFMRQIEEQPKWNAGVKQSQLICKVNRTTSHVKQVLRWNFLALRGDFNLNLAMTEEPHKMQITTQMLQGSMMRRFSSHVGVQRLGPNSCRLEMSLMMQPSIPVPFGVRHMVGSQVRKQLHGVLQKVKDTMDQQPPQQAPDSLTQLFGQPLAWQPLLLGSKQLANSSSSSCNSLAKSISSISTSSSGLSPVSFSGLPPFHESLVGMLKDNLKVQPLDIRVW